MNRIKILQNPVNFFNCMASKMLSIISIISFRQWWSNNSTMITVVWNETFLKSEFVHKKHLITLKINIIYLDCSIWNLDGVLYLSTLERNIQIFCNSILKHVTVSQNTIEVNYTWINKIGIKYFEIKFNWEYLLSWKNIKLIPM